MLKKLIVGALSAIVVAAIGVSVYNALAGSSPQAVVEAQPTAVSEQATTTTAAQGLGQGNGPAWQSNNNGNQAANQGTSQGSQANLANSNLAGQMNGAAQGQGRGYRGGGRGGNNANASQAGTGIPAPQNGFQEWVTLSGTVSSYVPPNFTLLTSDGQSIEAQLGNLSYVTSLGLELQEVQQVSLTGYYDPSGSLAVGQITLSDSGQTFELRDELGRPMWAGGPSR
jgi:hypothetical protein